MPAGRRPAAAWVSGPRRDARGLRRAAVAARRDARAIGPRADVEQEARLAARRARHADRAAVRDQEVRPEGPGGRGTICRSSRSTLTGSVSAVNPSRHRERPHVRVDGDALGEPNALPQHHGRGLAARRPGASRAARSCAAPCRRGARAGRGAAPRSERAFWLWKPVGKIAFAISPSSASANAAGVGKRANSSGVTMLTRASVHWAERIVATSSSQRRREVERRCAPRDRPRAGGADDRAQRCSGGESASGAHGARVDGAGRRRGGRARGSRRRRRRAAGTKGEPSSAARTAPATPRRAAPRRRGAVDAG